MEATMSVDKSQSVPHELSGAPARRPSESRRDQVYVSLRAALMDGTIGPWDRLGEVRLAERFETSRTPVREALARLQSDGLVEKRDGGLYLHMPSFDDLIGLYELRITLELQGIRRAIDDPELRHNRAILEHELDKWYRWRTDMPAPDAGFVSVDEGFHTALLGSSGNKAMTDALVAVNRQIRPVRMYDYLTDDRMEATVGEHIDIAEKVLAGRLADALEALHTHVGASRDVVMERAARVLQAANIAAGR
jgi:DNA-binding GntR family transcriptional regulator